MIRRTPGSPLTDTLFPYPPLIRSLPHAAADDDLLAEVGPAVEAGAEQRPRPDQQSRSRAEPAERLAERHRDQPAGGRTDRTRSEEHTSELQSLKRNSYAVLCMKKKKKTVFC